MIILEIILIQIKKKEKRIDYLDGFIKQGNIWKLFERIVSNCMIISSDATKIIKSMSVSSISCFPQSNFNLSPGCKSQFMMYH